MPFIQVREKTTEAQGAFRAHRTWLRAFAQAAGFDPIGSSKTTLEKIACEVIASSDLKKVTVRKSPALGQVRASLANAWGTELLLGLSGKYATEDALRRLTNNWGVVQLYYTLYHATQALFVAETGQPRPEAHPKTQNIFTDRWTVRAHAPAFLALAWGPGGAENVPGSTTIDHRIHQWSRCDPTSCWSHAVVALRSTWRDEVKDGYDRARDAKQRANRKAWRVEEDRRASAGKARRHEPSFSRPLLPAAEKEEVALRVGAYSFIHYAYRLRIKTNYDDSSMFTEGPSAEGEAASVHQDLIRLSAASMLVHELYVRALLGDTAMRLVIDAWLGHNNPPGAKLTLALRRDLILAT